MSISAQQFTLSGKVSDQDGNAIELATVSCLEQGAVTMANLKGEYSLKLQSKDSVVVRFSMVGYQTKTRVLRNPRGNQKLQIQLQPMEALQEVVVTERRRQTTGTDQLDAKNLRQTPSTTGNAVEELVQQQAGVSTHNELSSQYNVRGGSFDENSVYINNVEVYRPLLIRSGQQEGLSIINSDMVEKIGFSSGGFEAKYGDKMSSVLDIQYRRPTRFEGNVNASLLGAGVFLGYASKEKVTINGQQTAKFTMSHGLRYKSTRYLLGSLETKGEYRPNFLDYQTYITYQPNERWSLDILDYQTYITYQPNERWSLDIIGNISENHYNFQPTDRETSFGTMQNVRTFKVYFDGEERDIFFAVHRIPERTRARVARKIVPVRRIRTPCTVRATRPDIDRRIGRSEVTHLHAIQLETTISPATIMTGFHLDLVRLRRSSEDACRHITARGIEHSIITIPHGSHTIKNHITVIELRTCVVLPQLHEIPVSRRESLQSQAGVDTAPCR